MSLPTVQTPPDPAYLRHKVKRGETLAKIARRYGVSVGELARANRLGTKSKVHRGQVLRVPNADVATLYRSPAAAKSSSVSNGASGGGVYSGIRTVRIRPGDTLSTIAERHGTDVRTLRALNNLRPREHIRAGGTLKVPKQG